MSDVSDILDNSTVLKKEQAEQELNGCTRSKYFPIIKTARSETSVGEYYKCCGVDEAAIQGIRRASQKDKIDWNVTRKKVENGQQNGRARFDVYIQRLS